MDLTRSAAGKIEEDSPNVSKSQVGSSELIPIV